MNCEVPSDSHSDELAWVRAARANCEGAEELELANYIHVDRDEQLSWQSRPECRIWSIPILFGECCLCTHNTLVQLLKYVLR